MTGFGSATILPFPSRDTAVVLSDPPDDDVQITFRIDLADVRPAVWRRLEVAGSVPLDVLNDLLCMAMGWDNSHLHQFWPGQAWRGPRFLTTWDIEEEGDEGIAEADVRLDQILRKAGDKLRWSYDFGDGWEHVLKAEKVRRATDDDPSMRCIAGRNACPLEDCGGPPGHAEIRQLLANDPSRDTWPENLREWVPQDYDPDHFDSEEVNMSIALMAASPEEVQAAFQQTVTETFGDIGGLAPPVEEFLHGLPTQATAALSMLAMQSANKAEDVPDLAAAVRPWQLLLDIAHPDGIPLTAAGWMKPVVVQELVTATGLTGAWFGRANREDKVFPVADLRSSAVNAGLLRKHKGRLLLTKLGSTVRTDQDALFTALAAGLLRGKADSAESAARALLMLHVAAGMNDEDAINEAVDWMNMLGWVSGGDEPIQGHNVRWLTHLARATMGWTTGDIDVLHLTGREYGPAARAMARRAIWLPR